MTDANRWLVVAVVSVLAMIALLFSIRISPGHDGHRPDLDGWYRALHSKAKAWCCDGSDATHLADVDWESKDGHYRVRIEGEWVNVPDDAVIDDPNRDGRALVWPTYSDGKRSVRCFLPGAMT